MPARLRALDLTPHKHASRGAAKVREYRLRRRAGLQILKVPVLQFETAQYLVETGRLTVGQALDPKLVAHACGQVLAELAERWSKETVTG